MQLAQRKRDAAMAQTAVVQIKAARDALTAGRYLSAGYYETQLKIADSIAEQLKGR
jgi:predicted NAD/FAD-binding protein